MNCSVVMSSVARRLLQSLQQVEVVAVRVLEGGHAGAPLVFPPGIDHISFVVSVSMRSMADCARPVSCSAARQG